MLWPPGSGNHNMCEQAFVVASKARRWPWVAPSPDQGVSATLPAPGWVASRGDEDRGGKRWQGGDETTASRPYF